MSLARYYYTGPEIREMFSWTSRSIVSQTAKREGWKSVTLGRSKLYNKVHVDDYKRARQRTQLARKVTWLVGVSNHLVRDKSFDMDCPICKQFAIGNNISKDNEEWVCVSGHASGTAVSQEDNDNKID